jgi:N-acetylmuramoyl-L-alanine amidase
MRVAVVAVIVALAAHGAAASPLLEAVEVTADHGNSIRLRLTAPVSAEAHTLPAEGDAPARIYVDLQGAARGTEVPHVTTGAGDVLRVRTAQFNPGTLRVVIDLARRHPFAVRDTGGTITIALDPASLPEPAPDTIAAARPPSPPARIPVPSVPAIPRPAAAPPPAPAPAVAKVVPARPAEASPAPAIRSALRPTPERHVAPPHVQPVIVLDAGHGGRDPGAAGLGGIVEKDLVLDVTRRLARRLMARLPVDVVLTRTDDSFVPIERRLALPGEGATLFVSLHANACDDPSARGLEVFYGGGTLRHASSGSGDARAALLGRALDHALEERIGGVRGNARPAGFVVLARNPVPSALVEIGYLTHPDEAARAADASYRELLADALVDGIAAFLRAAAPPL